MIEDAQKLVEQLNSPSDWAVVLGAATVGFVLDGAINIVPIPFFSPGICGLTAGSAALSGKRAIEALRQKSRLSKRRQTLTTEARRCISALLEAGRRREARDFEWELQLDEDDDKKLETLVRLARKRLSQLADGEANTTTVAGAGFGSVSIKARTDDN